MAKKKNRNNKKKPDTVDGILTSRTEGDAKPLEPDDHSEPSAMEDPAVVVEEDTAKGSAHVTTEASSSATTSSNDNVDSTKKSSISASNEGTAKDSEAPKAEDAANTAEPSAGVPSYFDDQGEKASEKKKKKQGGDIVTSEDIRGIVMRKIPFARIDGKLCYYNGKYFVPVKSQSEIESLIYNNIPGILEGGSMRLLKEAAYIICRLYSFPDNEPAETRGYLGFANGIYVYNPKTGAEYSFTHFGDETPPACPPTDASDSYIDLSIPGPWNSSYPCKFPSPTPVADSDIPIKITHLLNANFLKQYAGMHIDGAPAYPTIVNGQPSLPFPFPLVTHQFFSSIAGGDLVLIARIWEMLACILVPDPSVKKFFLLEGLPDSGKSVLGNFIKSFFHPENVSSLDFSRLGDKYSASVLPGTYLNVSMDLPNRTISTKSIAMLKMLTGDDDITIEPKFQDARSYRNRCRFLFASNHHLKLAEDDQAFINRLVLIPFRYTPQQKDPELLNKLKQERDAVAAYAIQYYYPSIKQRNFVFSGTGNPKFDAVVNASGRFNNIRLSHLQMFTDKYCVVTGNEEDFVYTEKLYTGYLAFCKETAFTNYPDYRHFTPLFKEIIGDSVWFKKRHTMFTEEGKRMEINQSCCFGLKYLQEPMTFYE